LLLPELALLLPELALLLPELALLLPELALPLLELALLLPGRDLEAAVLFLEPHGLEQLIRCSGRQLLYLLRVVWN
jgi:hypothetical protein